MASVSTILNQSCVSMVVGVRLQGSTIATPLVSLPTMLGGQNSRLESMRKVTRRSQPHPPKRGMVTESRAVTEEQAQAQRVKKASAQRTFISTTLAQRWREVQGGTDWKGLLDPMDAEVRAELIRYGEFAQACYDAFDKDEHSKYQGSCRYSKEHLLANVGIPDSGYTVTKFLYSTTNVTSLLLLNETQDAWSRSSNWAGFVAVCTDETRIRQLGRRDIVVAWRGTNVKLEWAANLKTSLVPSSLDDRDKRDEWYNPKVKMEEGFLSLYATANSQTRYNKSSAREQLLTELRRVIKKYDHETLSITVTGHSLGGALAVLSAYDIAESGINRHSEEHVKVPTEWNEPTVPTPTSDPAKTKGIDAIPLTVFSFAGPRVGNSAFVERIHQLGVKVLRVVNVKDFVPRVPGLVLNEELRVFNNLIDKLPWTYSHCGVELEVNSDHSPFLKPKGGIGNVHNLEGYLHLVAGFQGKAKGVGQEFKLMLRRDIALVNKASDFLKPQRYIPASWWQLPNKGLVLSEDFQWVQAERDTEDVPIPDDA